MECKMDRVDTLLVFILFLIIMYLIFGGSCSAMSPQQPKKVLPAPTGGNRLGPAH